MWAHISQGNFNNPNRPLSKVWVINTCTSVDKQKLNLYLLQILSVYYKILKLLLRKSTYVLTFPIAGLSFLKNKLILKLFYNSNFTRWSHNLLFCRPWNKILKLFFINHRFIWISSQKPFYFCILFISWL